MPTSSLVSVARLLRQRTMRTLAGVLAAPLPVTARQLIDRAAGTFLPGWALVTEEAIAADEANRAWHTGHVEDVLSLGAGRLVIASATGGVWVGSMDPASPPVPVSNGWPEVDMHCLGTGPRGPGHVFAGGLNVLYETGAASLRALTRFARVGSFRQVAAVLGLVAPISLRALMRMLPDAPLFDWRRIPVVDTSGNSLFLNIRKLAVVTDVTPAKLVLATDSGVYWSDVPRFGQGYQFAAATGMPAGQCLAVALSAQGPGGVRFVVCSPTGAIATPQSNGLYVGTWQGGTLAMQRARHAGDIDFVQWQFAVVASSAGDRSRLYAAVSASGTARLSLRDAFRKAVKGLPHKLTRLTSAMNIPLPATLSAIIRRINPPKAYDLLYAVLTSSDGGVSWAPVGPQQQVEASVQLPRDPGHTQSGYNLSIAVSHVDPGTVALGWRIGPWIGRATPQAFVWEEHGDLPSRPGFSPHIHSDSHGLHFDPADPHGRTLFACSDGGVIFTRDLCASFDSSVNRRLPVLEFQSYPSHAGGFSGASGVSPRTPGLAAGALQDNGVVATSRAAGAQRPWTRLVGGDGMVSIVLEHDHLLYWYNDTPPTARIAKWNGSAFGAAADVPVRTPSPSLSAGQALASPVMEPVLRPAFRRPASGQLMYAIAACDAAGTAGELWGLFTDDDGSNARWDFLAGLNAAVNGVGTAIGSDDGRRVLVGTAQGRIFSYDSASGSLTETPLDPAVVTAGQVYQFSFLDRHAVARYQTALRRFDAQTNRWTGVGGNGLPTSEGALQFTAVDVGRSPQILYAATDVAIHATWDGGANWLPVSRGLPARAHPSTLRFVSESDRSRHLYLFTYGRSAWKARLH